MKARFELAEAPTDCYRKPQLLAIDTKTLFVSKLFRGVGVVVRFLRLTRNARIPGHSVYTADTSMLA